MQRCGHNAVLRLKLCAASVMPPSMLRRMAVILLRFELVRTRIDPRRGWVSFSLMCHDWMMRMVDATSVTVAFDMMCTNAPGRSWWRIKDSIPDTSKPATCLIASRVAAGSAGGDLDEG